jgi:choloylglycine hydrolase
LRHERTGGHVARIESDVVAQVRHVPVETYILNNFDIPVGVARDEQDGVVHTDYKMLTTARNPQALKYYWKTYDDQTIRSVDMRALDPEAKAIVRVSTGGQQTVVDSKQMK